MEENHEQDRDSEMENESPSVSNNEEEANSDGDSMEVSGYGNDDENLSYRNGALAAAAAELMRRHGVMQGNHPGLNLTEGHEREHEDILSKLKMQVRDMKVDSSQLNDLATTANLTPNTLQDHINSIRARAPTTPFLFAPNRAVSIPEDGNFQFTSPMQFPTQLHHFMPQTGPSPANNPGSNPPSTSPQSSEGSGGSNQNNWSFEEQFKQMLAGARANMPGYLNNNYLSGMFNFPNNQRQTDYSNQSNSGNSNNGISANASSLTNGRDQRRSSVSPPLTSRCRSPKRGRHGGRNNNLNRPLSAAEAAEQEERRYGHLDYTNTTSTTFDQHRRRLYELTDDPARKIMLDELFSYNQRRGAPINRLPIMAKTVLDLYELFNLVVARGGLVEVINKKLWQEIIKGLKLPSSITSAAFTLRTQYMKFLFAYECEKYNFSTNEELQAAIDGNRREGRRSSYGAHYENMRPSGRSPNPVQMAQLAAVTRHQQQQEQQLISRLSSQLMANGHPVMHPPGLGQLNGAPIPGMGMPNLNINLEQYAAAARLLAERGSPSMHPSTTQSELNRTPSPNNHHAMTAAFNNNMVLFNSFLNNNNNIKPAPQEEALNLSEAAQPTTVKRERVDKDDEPSSPKKKSRESNNDEASSARISQPLNNHHSPQRTNIVINNREGDPVNGMVVNMEVNGVAYKGVLFPVTEDKVKAPKKNGS